MIRLQTSKIVSSAKFVFCYRICFLFLFHIGYSADLSASQNQDSLTVSDTEPGFFSTPKIDGLRLLAFSGDERKKSFSHRSEEIWRLNEQEMKTLLGKAFTRARAFCNYKQFSDLKSMTVKGVVVPVENLDYNIRYRRDSA